MQAVFDRLVTVPLRQRSGLAWPSEVLGVPHADIQTRILEMGRADFSVDCTHPAVGTVAATDRVLLYCYMNMRAHFYASLATFDAGRADLAPQFQGAGRPLFIDVGCGPATSGLAFAEHVGGTGTFDYDAHDLAPAMIAQAHTFITNARTNGVGGGSIGTFTANALPNHEHVIINASFLFASDSLDVRWIVQFVQDLIAARKSVVLVYTNSTNALACRKWIDFCAAIGIPDLSTQHTVDYRNKRGDPYTKTTHYMRAVIRLK